MTCSDFNIAVNCSDPGSPIEFDADPDVAGIGVILAFLISAWATFVFVIITFFFVETFDGTKNEMDSRVVKNTRKSKKFIRPFLPRLLKIERPFSLDAIEKVAFTLSDQQLITGISIFIVGFVRHCVITQYHFYVVYLLGVLSFTTHQSTMMIVAEKLRKRHWMRWWRLAAIFLIFSFSFVANIPAYNSYFLAEYGLVMQCVWSELPRYYNPYQIFQLILTSIFLFWGFVAVIRDICPEVGSVWAKPLAPASRVLDPCLHLFSPRRWHYWTRMKLTRARQTRKGETMWYLLNRISFIFFLVYFTILQIFLSGIVDLYRVWATLLYATYSVLSIRKVAAKSVTSGGEPALNGSEDTWGFGQILPMLLLALPSSQVWEMVWEDIEDRKEEDKKSRTAPVRSTTTNPSQGENIPLEVISSSPSVYQAPQRQEIGTYYHLRNESTREGSVRNEQIPIDTDITELPRSENRDTQENRELPNEQQHVKRRPRNVERVDTVSLERGPASQQAASSGSATANESDNFEVEKELYDSRWFKILLGTVVLVLFGFTAYFATALGIVF